MFKTNKILFLSAILLISTVISPGRLTAVMTSGSGYQIWADVISEGGLDHTSSTNYQLRDTLGEGAIGRASSTNYQDRSGFREMEKNPDVQTLTLALSSNSLNFGTLSRSASNIASHTLTLNANSPDGVQVVFTGNTLSSSGGSITAIGATAAAASAGANQFGFNVIYASGDATAASQAPYNGASLYAFNGGDTIISASGPMSSAAVFDVNYLANVSTVPAAGSYSAAITYTATANF